MERGACSVLRVPWGYVSRSTFHGLGGFWDLAQARNVIREVALHGCAHGVTRWWSPSQAMGAPVYGVVCACGMDDPLHRTVVRSGMDGPLQRGWFLVRERRAMRCIGSRARPQSRGAQRYGRPASAGRVPCVGTAGDGVHRKQSPSTEPWCAAVWTARFGGEGSSCGNGGR